MANEQPAPEAALSVSKPEAPRNFGEVFNKERSHIRPATADLSLSCDANEGDGPVVGVSLSGGGIRSAAFSLGAIQALEAQGAFEKVDFLSTVSGGGYTGAALLAGLDRSGGNFPFAAAAESDDPLAAADIADSAEVRGLRDRSRYLMPDGKFDLVVSLAIILRGLAVNAVMVAVPVFLIAALTLFAYPKVDDLHDPALFRALRGGTPNLIRHWEAFFGSAIPVSSAFGLIFVVWLVVWAIWRSVTASSSRSGGTSADPRSFAARATAHALIVFFVIALLELQPVVLVFLTSPETAGAAWLPKLSHAFAALSAGTGIFALSWKALLGRIQALAASPEWHAIFQRIGAHLTVTILAMALPLAIYLGYLGLVTWGMECSGSSCTASGGAHDLLPKNWVRPLLLGSWSALAIVTIWPLSVGPLGETLFSRLWWTLGGARRPSSIAAMVGSIAVVAVIFAAGYLFSARLDDLSVGRFASVLYLSVAAGAAVIASLFSDNANSLHRLYRDRLSEAFKLDGGGDCKGGSIHLSKLKGEYDDGQPRRPYPIINAAVNLQGSRNNRRQRDADFFVFTPDHVGSDATGYSATTDLEKVESHLDLATAVAISGAAVSSVMGRTGNLLLAPTLALLNIRLGYWLTNPKSFSPPPIPSPPPTAGASRIREWRLSYLVSEIFGLLNENLAKVYLTDGGHIDNLGLYQLLKRRCDVIFVVDAEADPAMNFPAFSDVERFARIDLGVRLELPWQSIRKSATTRREALKKDPACDATSPPHAHAAIGKILYPPVSGGVKGEDPRGKEGILVYVKASMTGDERSYVLDYERRNSSFPHESTGDQFFSEEQFEAYRALGFHSMTSAFTHTDGSPRWAGLLKDLEKQLKRHHLSD